MSEPRNGKYVTLSELNDKLDKLRWEVRVWIIVALIASQVIPNRTLSTVAQAASKAVGW